MVTAVIGGGPAGLAGAEVLSQRGSQVHLFDRMPSVGRKFLVAGSSGLNLTNALPAEEFPARYSGPAEFWKKILTEFTSEDLRQWAAELGIETYVGTSGKVFPHGQQAAPLLRRWVSRLRSRGVVFHMRHAWCGITASTTGWTLQFQTPDEILSYSADSVLLALGGASWPDTGSEGSWTSILHSHGVKLVPFTPANCGFDVAWPDAVREKAAGLPLKNMTATSNGRTLSGECLITQTGIEGGVIYPLGPEIRRTGKVTLDLKPTFSIDTLVQKLENPKGALLSTARRRWKLSEAAVTLLAARGPWTNVRALAETTKQYEICVTGPRPVAEAISSAGGVAWEELDDSLMIRRMPGIHVSGEMMDWEAPTGGFLLQGCFATARYAAKRIPA